MPYKSLHRLAQLLQYPPPAKLEKAYGRNHMQKEETKNLI
jgi:hypothetical protein